MDSFQYKTFKNQCYSFLPNDSPPDSAFFYSFTVDRSFLICFALFLHFVQSLQLLSAKIRSNMYYLAILEAQVKSLIFLGKYANCINYSSYMNLKHNFQTLWHVLWRPPDASCCWHPKLQYFNNWNILSWSYHTFQPDAIIRKFTVLL